MRATMILICLAVLATSQAAMAQDGTRARSTIQGSPAPRVQSLFSDASPSGWLATDGIRASQAVAAAGAGSSSASPGIRADLGSLPISQNIQLDQQDTQLRYQREQEARDYAVARARRKRELRELRTEIQEFYGISVARPTGSPMMFGGMQAPMGYGGWRYGMGVAGRYPSQRLWYSYR